MLGSVARIAVACGGLFAAGAVQAAEVNLYTTREPGLIRPLLGAYTAKTGVKVNTVFVEKGLAERVAAEGERANADVLMTVDIGNLIEIVDRGLAQPVKSPALEAAVPASLRDPDGRWFSLSTRARVAYTDAKDYADLKALSYEDLADPKWKGKICLRPGQHPYNTALIAHYLVKHGPEKTEAWLRGVKANLAKKPAGGDRDVARDILAETCEIGLGNSYYVGLMRSGRGGPEQVKWAEAIRVVLPTFENGGTHVNVSGAAVAKNAPNRDEAVKLLEFLVSDEAQGIYAQTGYEYPVKRGAPVDPLLVELGTLKIDDTPVAEIARNRKAASLLVDKVGFDN
ncbi:extracellular solute-binding protein [Methylobacterium oxalidis]|uniref:Iron ABC transporter substrate-binding protein n=1 Tax=Methylobacterium oxalidis TaxID=944322 RepID=A0A512J004_9HYPH|nr:extracellular solute-binding protein [Methylobacterium oxalidis]GEP03308.1 iron ABC transporter substrate-binding protein [Methylobacterium oxalidis]GJE30403.1 Iron uptake protein A1 [Methylobacterium oxalidis]GLS64186.1 iron ABC transporter substrate-binding protein [Methylobacterium oxalidis]